MQPSHPWYNLDQTLSVLPGQGSIGPRIRHVSGNLPGIGCRSQTDTVWSIPLYERFYKNSQVGNRSRRPSEPVVSTILSNPHPYRPLPQWVPVRQGLFSRVVYLTPYSLGSGGNTRHSVSPEILFCYEPSLAPRWRLIGSPESVQ